MQSFTIKRGDTFYVLGELTNAQGLTQSLDGYSLSAELRDGGFYLVHTFELQVMVATDGTFEFKPFDTSGLPIAQYLIDLIYRVNGVVISTVSHGLKVVRSLTSHVQNFAWLPAVHGTTRLNLTQAAINSVVVTPDLFDVPFDIEWF